MAPMNSVMPLVLLSLGCFTASSYDVEVISDITAPSPSMDAGRALEIKNQQFWEPVLKAAEGQELQGHATLYKDAEAAIEQLSCASACCEPQKLCIEHPYVRTALREALESLRRADAAVLAQARQHSEIASEQLAAPARGMWETFSFLTGGQNFLGQALQRFLDFGGYSPKLRGQIEERKASVLPALQGAAGAAGNVLSDCRAASRRSFDLLKHDIYNREAAKTPQAAKDVANRIIDAATETRRRFLGLVTASVEGLTRDSQREHENPSAIVTQSLLASMEERVAPSGKKEELRINL